MQEAAVSPYSLQKVHHFQLNSMCHNTGLPIRVLLQEEHKRSAMRRGILLLAVLCLVRLATVTTGTQMCYLLDI